MNILHIEFWIQGSLAFPHKCLITNLFLKVTSTKKYTGVPNNGECKPIIYNWTIALYVANQTIYQASTTNTYSLMHDICDSKSCTVKFVFISK